MNAPELKWNKDDRGGKKIPKTKNSLTLHNVVIKYIL